MRTIKVSSREREEMVEITREVEEALRKLIGGSQRSTTPSAQSGGLASYPEGEPVSSGVVALFTQHTTCGLTINENADPDVKSDMLGFLRRLIPQYEPNFKHSEHNSDAHIKASLTGSSVMVPFADGELLLGRWQGIYLCEFDGPRERTVIVQVKKAEG